MRRLNNTIGGILCGLALPIVFIWIYLYNFYPGEAGIIASAKSLWGSALFGKLLLLSLMPDLILTFIFYKRDSFKFGAGVITGMLPFLILSIMMIYGLMI